MFAMSQDEEQRLSALFSYGILDSDFEETFDRITRLAASMFSAPICLISLIDRERQWFKSATGLTARETPRSQAFCAHAIQGADVMVVPDSLKDARFSENPLVTGAPAIRFYAGAPLITAEGFGLGTICVIDKVPRQSLSREQSAMLRDFAGIVMDLLEARKQSRELRAAISGTPLFPK